jgi:hypothetical protein
VEDPVQDPPLGDSAQRRILMPGLDEEPAKRTVALGGRTSADKPLTLSERFAQYDAVSRCPNPQGQPLAKEVEPFQQPVGDEEPQRDSERNGSDPEHCIPQEAILPVAEPEREQVLAKQDSRVQSNGSTGSKLPEDHPLRNIGLMSDSSSAPVRAEPYEAAPVLDVKAWLKRGVAQDEDSTRDDGGCLQEQVGIDTSRNGLANWSQKSRPEESCDALLPRANGDRLAMTPDQTAQSDVNMSRGQRAQRGSLRDVITDPSRTQSSSSRIPPKRFSVTDAANASQVTETAIRAGESAGKQNTQNSLARPATRRRLDSETRDLFEDVPADFKAQLTEFLKQARLPDECVMKALEWSHNVGAVDMSEVLRLAHELERYLGLALLEQRRFREMVARSREKWHREEGGESHVTEELLPGLRSLLDGALLSDYIPKAEEWVEEHGVDTIDEIAEFADEFKASLELNFMDRRRLDKVIEAHGAAMYGAVDGAAGSAEAAFSVPLNLTNI